MPPVFNVRVTRILLFCSLFCIISNTVTAQASDEQVAEATQQLLDEQGRQVKMVVLLALLPILVAFAFITFVFYRRKREAFFRQTEAELKLSKAEVEIKALKAQINPHFIFNCMNSIHHFMHKNDIQKAGDYLIKFSQLIRIVLENSSRDTITLKEDLHALNLYIQLEQMRLENKFDYAITVEKDVNPDEAEIPALLIQPFVENAIWHELTKVAEQGFLSVAVRKHEDGIQCHIKSQGIGRTHPSLSTALTDGITKTSMGQSLIRERLELINRMNRTKAGFTSRDISQADQNKFGHEVELFVPLKDEFA